jgi:ferrochelatase
VRAVTEGLQIPWSLAYQSRNGRLPWLQPYLEDELTRLGRAGIDAVVIVPISFVSDHIETLFELDQLYRRVAQEHGIKHYYRARCFNDNPHFPRVLQTIVTEALA